MSWGGWTVGSGPRTHTDHFFLSVCVFCSHLQAQDFGRSAGSGSQSDQRTAKKEARIRLLNARFARISVFDRGFGFKFRAPNCSNSLHFSATHAVTMFEYLFSQLQIRFEFARDCGRGVLAREHDRSGSACAITKQCSEKLIEKERKLYSFCG